jgi:hypothetical protein
MDRQRASLTWSGAPYICTAFQDEMTALERHPEHVCETHSQDASQND